MSKDKSATLPGALADALTGRAVLTNTRAELLQTIKPLAVVSEVRAWLKLSKIVFAMFLSLTFALFAIRGGILTFLWLASVATSVWTQHAIAEEIHDGVHQRIFRNAKLNDFVSKIYASLIGVSFLGFRREHLQHHRYFGSHQDPDYEKYANVPRGLRSWMVYFAKYFTGYAAIGRLLRRPRRDATDDHGRLWQQHLVGTFLAQVSLLTISALVVGPVWYFVCWAGTLLTITYGITQFRTLLEHWSPQGWTDPRTNEPRIGALHNLTGAIQSNLFGAQFGYNYHGSHHLQASVPNYNLHKLANLSEEYELGSQPVRTVSFLRRVKEVFRG